MFQFFKSEFFNFEFVRLLGFAPFEGGEIAEILEAVGEIKDLDPESWYAAWTKAGAKAEAIADEAEQSGDRTAARRAYLRASNYLRAAQFMLNSRPGHDDIRVLPTLETAVSNFRRAAKLMEGDVHFLNIPYENDVELPAYLYLPQASKRLPGKLPVLIVTGGGDSTQEELYFINPVAGVELGYAVLTFDGPGQGLVLRRDKLVMRPDWEVVTSKVLDFVHAFSKDHPEINLDMDRLALTGASMGGYYALRGAADPRVKAVVSTDPFYSMWDLLKGRMPDFLINSFETGAFASDAFWNNLVGLLSWLNFQVKWEFDHLKWVFGVKTAADVMRCMMQWTLSRPDESEYLHSVQCPVFVTGAASSIYAKPEISTTRIFNELGHLRADQKKEWISRDVAEGGLQAKVGAFGLSAQRTFAWLDGQFGIERKIAFKT